MTLVQFWTEERNRYRDRKTAVGTALTQLQQRLDKAKNADQTQGDPADGLKTAQSALTALDAKIVEKRAALAKATIPAEAQALVLEIRDLQVQQRIKNGEILDLQETADALQSEVDAQSQLLQRLTARLAESEATLKTAEDAQKRRDKLKTRVTTSPVKDVPGLATAAKTGTDHNSAEARIDELPAELRGLAQKRLDLRTKRMADAEAQARAAVDEQITQREAWGGEGKVEQERAAFLRAEQAIQDLASTGQPEYDRAVNIFKVIAAGALLSPSETAAIPVSAARTAAAGNADTVIGSQAAVDAALLDLESTEFGKLAADPDADLSTDATVNGKKTTLAAARTALKDDSTTNYPDKQTTDEWQAIVPDRGWKSVVDFLDATAALNRLSALSPSGQVTDLDTKEAAYAAALAALAKTRRRLEYVEDVVAQRGKRVDSLIASRSLRLVSAVRGDTF